MANRLRGGREVTLEHLSRPPTFFQPFTLSLFLPLFFSISLFLFSPFYRWYKPRSGILKVIPAPNKISKLFATNFSPAMVFHYPDWRVHERTRSIRWNDCWRCCRCSSKRGVRGRCAGCSVFQEREDFFISLKWIFRGRALVAFAYFMPSYILPASLIARHTLGLLRERICRNFAYGCTCLNAPKIRRILNTVAWYHPFRFNARNAPFP